MPLKADKDGHLTTGDPPSVTSCCTFHVCCRVMRGFQVLEDALEGKEYLVNNTYSATDTAVSFTKQHTATRRAFISDICWRCACAGSIAVNRAVVWVCLAAAAVALCKGGECHCNGCVDAAPGGLQRRLLCCNEAP